jgi:hypothetical protein
MLCQLRPLVYSLGPSNPPRISFTLVKSLVKSLRRYKLGDSRSKMAGAGFHSIANSRVLKPRIARTIISHWQAAYYCTADIELPL